MTARILPTRPDSPPVAIITIPRVAATLPTRGTLRPRTHVVGQRLGVGYTPDDAATQTRQTFRRDAVETLATETLGAPEEGWTWEGAN